MSGFWTIKDSDFTKAFIDERTESRNFALFVPPESDNIMKQNSVVSVSLPFATQTRCKVLSGIRMAEFHNNPLP